MNQQRLMPPTVDRPPRRGAERIVYPENRRYRRIRTVSMLMDQSIVLPSGYRIGLDPLIGLLPGIGDALASLVSCYLIYESARLGIRKRVLARMVGNVIIDSLVGSFPVLGDVFDAVWKSNMRNLRLLDQHYHPAVPERSAWKIAGWMIGVATLLVLATGLVFFFTVQVLLHFVGLLFPFFGR
jgi:hypothetical protein